MKALVYVGPNKKALEERPKPELRAPTDVIVKITHTTICGTDLLSSRVTYRRANPVAS